MGVVMERMAVSGITEASVESASESGAESLSESSEANCAEWCREHEERILCCALVGAATGVGVTAGAIIGIDISNGK